MKKTRPILHRKRCENQARTLITLHKEKTISPQRAKQSKDGVELKVEQ